MIAISTSREAARGGLEEFFDRIFLDNYLSDADPETIRQYRLTIRRWREGTGDPPLATITPGTLAAFRRWRQGQEPRQPPAADRQLRLFDEGDGGWGSGDGEQRRPCAKATVNKDLRHVQHMISKLGPAGPKNRDALGILRECPWAKPLKLPRPRPRVAGDAELAAIYAASIDERLPSIDGVDPAAWWQALLVAAIATDCRREALFGLEWCDVDFRTMAVTIRFENDKEDCERVKPISEILARHLLRIRAAPRPFFWPHGQRTWYQRWHAIQARAGVHARLRANHGEHYTLHEMKGAGLSRLAAFASPGVVQFMGDHASAETARHYVDLAARPEVRQAVDTLRLPENFYAGFDPPAIDAG